MDDFLDESMSSCLNQHCPGFMYVEHKPHPSGNEYHSIADRRQGKLIMWQVKLQEGKYHPKNNHGMPWFPSEFENNTKDSAIMPDMAKPIHNIGKDVVMACRFLLLLGSLFCMIWGCLVKN